MKVKYVCITEIFRNKGVKSDPTLNATAKEMLQMNLSIDYDLYDFVTQRFEAQLKKYDINV